MPCPFGLYYPRKQYRLAGHPKLCQQLVACITTGHTACYYIEGQLNKDYVTPKVTKYQRCNFIIQIHKFTVKIDTISINLLFECVKIVEFLKFQFPRVSCHASRDTFFSRACLHGVGDPGLVGLVSFVFTLWRTQNKRNLPY